MFSLKKRKKSEDTEDANYWLSIGDLMASILIIFILLFISKTLETGKELQKKETIIENFTSIKKKIIAKLKNEFDKKNIKIVCANYQCFCVFVSLCLYLNYFSLYLYLN